MFVLSVTFVDLISFLYFYSEKISEVCYEYIMSKPYFHGLIPALHSSATSGERAAAKASLKQGCKESKTRSNAQR